MLLNRLRATFYISRLSPFVLHFPIRAVQTIAKRFYRDKLKDSILVQYIAYALYSFPVRQLFIDYTWNYLQEHVFDREKQSVIPQKERLL